MSLERDASGFSTGRQPRASPSCSRVRRAAPCSRPSTPICGSAGWRVVTTPSTCGWSCASRASAGGHTIVAEHVKGWRTRPLTRPHGRPNRGGQARPAPLPCRSHQVCWLLLHPSAALTADEQACLTHLSSTPARRSLSPRPWPRSSPRCCGSAMWMACTPPKSHPTAVRELACMRDMRALRQPESRVRSSASL